MVRLDTILVAYDFSPHSEAALRTAVSLARAFKSKIRLVHSCGIPIAGTMPYDAAIPADVYNSIREAAVERLEAVRSTAAAQGLDVTADVTTFFPVEAVLEAADKIGASLIVAGTRGLTGLKHAVLGSTAERIVRLAKCPVLTVREGGQGALPRRIVLATDFSDEGANAMRRGAELAKQIGAEVHVVHAFDVPLEPVTRYGIAIPTNIIPVAREAARARLDAAVAEVRATGVKVEGHLTDVPAAPAIAEIAKDVSADLVVMGTHGFTGLRHLLLGSVAERTLRLAPCAVLTMKSAEGSAA
jgi:nucleotide-binding universal stress UspA family protein